MFDDLLLLDILKNPVLLGLLFAIIRNLGGYITECFRAKKLVPYSKSSLLETMSLYETFFITLGGVASVPQNWVAVITVLVDVIRSFKKVVEDWT